MLNSMQIILLTMHLVAAKMSSNFCFKTLPSLSGLKQNRNTHYFGDRDNFKREGGNGKMGHGEHRAIQ